MIFYGFPQFQWLGTIYIWTVFDGFGQTIIWEIKQRFFHLTVLSKVSKKVSKIRKVSKKVSKKVGKGKKT